MVLGIMEFTLSHDELSNSTVLLPRETAYNTMRYALWTTMYRICNQKHCECFGVYPDNILAMYMSFLIYPIGYVASCSKFLDNLSALTIYLPSSCLGGV